MTTYQFMKVFLVTWFWCLSLISLLCLTKYLLIHNNQTLQKHYILTKDNMYLTTYR